MKRFAIYILLVFLNIGYACAQKSKIDVKAMQAALAEVIHKHSNVDGGDTIAAELAKKFKNDPEVLTHIAKAYMQNRTTDKARKYLDKAIKIKPDGYSPALVVKADIFKEESQIDSAALYYEKAVAADSTNAEAYVGYAMMYAKYPGGIDKSIAMLEKARGRVPYFNVDAAIADCYDESGDAQNSIEAIGNMDWEKLGESQMSTYCVNLYLAGKYDQGVEAANYCVKKWPTNMDFKKMKLWHCAQMKMYDDAITNGTAYLSSDSPERFRSVDYFSMAYSYLGKGMITEALEYFDKMDEINPENDRLLLQMKPKRPGAIAGTASIFLEANDYSTALLMYDTIIEHYPEADAAYYSILKSNVYIKQYSDAPESEKPTYLQKIFDIYSLIETKYPENTNIGYILYSHAELLRSNSNEDEDIMRQAGQYYEKYYNYYITHTGENQSKACLSCYWNAVIEWKINDNVVAARQWIEKGFEIDPMEQNLLKIDEYVSLAEQNQPKKKKKR